MQITYSPDEVFSRIQHEGIQFIDLQFTGLTGHFHHTTISANTFTPEQMKNGLPKLDGSSIVGFTTIDDSELLLKPDPSTFAIIPWMTENKTARLLCDVYWGEDRGRLSRDPRGIAQKAEEYIKTQGFDFSTWGPEVEFFVFDKVHWDVLTPYKGQSYSIESKEAPWSNDGDGYPMGLQEGYYPTTPSDTLTPYRNECVNILSKNFGILCDNHHHEVATAGQCEIGIRFNTLVKKADEVQILKYCVHNVAHAYGKTATFMPKPLVGDNGSGMHCHQSFWKDGENQFAGDSYAGLSETALYYIGGIIKHAKAINAFANASTNSYKRLIPGFEAPVMLAYSARNRSASIRIPYVPSPKGKRIEARFGDPTANPYLMFAAMLMAGIDGVKNKLHPGDAADKDLYDLPAEEAAAIPQVAGSLREALESLDGDREFLTSGGVFTNDMIEAYIELKMEEVYAVEHTTHPVEFDMYYSV